ncbi:DoxX-like family protein [Massilia sp. W12]|uniref:DoxX-like family protein n=1 Tax=Massilia sp. W12 TaxID=3126507 RepID=UPI0030D00067
MQTPLPPYSAARERLCLLICTLSLGLCWLYQGLVPKLLGPDAMELQLAQHITGSADAALWFARAGGVAEILFALWLLSGRYVRLALWLSLLAMPALLALTFWAAPAVLRTAFNPVALNLAMAALAIVGLLHSAPHTPSSNQS